MNDHPGQSEIPFGRRYEGKTIDEIAATDRGLLHLDKLLGQLPKKWKITRDIAAYLSDPAIAKELDDLLLEN